MTFISTINKGFRMNFDKGFEISVQWGLENYCEKQSYLKNRVYAKIKGLFCK